MSVERPTEMSFWDHLDEFRWRLLRMAIYIVVAMLLSWAFRNDLLSILRYPAEAGAAVAGIEEFEFRIFEAAGGIMLMMMIALVTGIIAASPLIITELWLFVEPALEKHEKRWAVVMIPAATVLFLGGVVFCYWVSPRAFAFLFGFNVGLGVAPELTLQPYLYFLMRLLLVFGLSFELPLVLMFLAHVGFVTRAQLLGFWRQAVVVIFVFAAFVTPTTDPVTLTFLAAPMIILYVLSIFLAGLVEKRRDEDPLELDEPMPAYEPDDEYHPEQDVVDVDDGDDRSDGQQD